MLFSKTTFAAANVKITAFGIQRRIKSRWSRPYCLHHQGEQTRFFTNAVALFHSTLSFTWKKRDKFRILKVEVVEVGRCFKLREFLYIVSNIGLLCCRFNSFSQLPPPPLRYPSSPKEIPHDTNTQHYISHCMRKHRTRKSTGKTSNLKW
jgi:hypothetical protein